MKPRLFRILTVLCLAILAACLTGSVILSVPLISAKIPSVFLYEGKISGLTNADPIVLINKGGIDLNSADLDTLCSLEGIGPVKAQAIIAFREENGAFRYPEDLMLVKGIGEGLFEKNRDRICCLPPETEKLQPIP